MPEPQTALVEADELHRATQEILQAAGVPEDDARVTADSLVDANLHGVDTHGVIRLKPYVDRLRAAGNNPTPAIQVLRESPVAAALDGDNALGQVAGHRAMQMAIAKAEAAGIGIATVRNANHYGTAAWYTRMAAKRDLIGCSSTNVLLSMPPTGGAEPLLGNNPLSFAFPAGEEPAVVFDCATSKSSWGVLFTSQQKGTDLPPDCFFDAAGRATVDPAAVMAGGGLLPIAEHKGYGLALSLALLTGILADGTFDTDIPHPYKLPDKPGDNSFFMMAIRIDQFIDVDRFKARMDEIIRKIRSSRRAPGVDRLYLPGEIEHETARQRRAEGIPLNPQMLAELQELAAEAGIAFPQRRDN